MNKRVAIVGWVAIGALLVGSLEGVSYLALTKVVLHRVGFLLYQSPKSIGKADYERYQRIRDPLLGWPSTERRDRELDASGSRPTPAFPVPCNVCVSLYGDSFTYASGVGNADAWGNVLAERLGCRVSNFGGIGYGTDQALLRFEQNTADRAPVTILGIYPDDVLRNLNQSRFFLARGSPFGFKPRFILENETLRLIPIPTLAYEELPLFFKNPQSFLPHETFLPDSVYGQERLVFPYFFTLIRVVSKERTVKRIQGLPSWLDFLRPGHSTRSFELTLAITSRFMTGCRQRRKACFVVIFPTRSSYRWFRKTGKLATGALADRLIASGIPALDLTQPIAEKLGERNYRQILGGGSHFNAEGYRFVAEIVHTYLVERQFAKPL